MRDWFIAAFILTAITAIASLPLALALNSVFFAALYLISSQIGFVLVVIGALAGWFAKENK